MKYLPCVHCRKTALATKAGLLQSAGRMIDHSMRYLCVRCGRTTVLSSAEFVRLPDMTADEIRAASCDIDASALDEPGAPVPAPKP